MTLPIAELDALYTAPPGEFTAARNALVAKLKARGASDRARAVASRKKPTLAAYVLNQLARRHPAEVEKLVDLGRRLERAQRAAARGAPSSELRTLLEAQRKTIASVIARATRTATELGANVARNELSQALRAALVDPGVGAALEAGTLSVVPTLGEDGEDALALAMPAANEAPHVEPRPASRKRVVRSEREAAARERRDEAARKKRAAAEAREADRERERAEAERAAARHAEAERTEAERARARRAAAKEKAAAARTEALRARRERAEAVRSARRRKAAAAAERIARELEAAARRAVTLAERARRKADALAAP